MLAVTVALAVGLWAVALTRWRMPGQSLRKRAFDSDGPTDAHNLRCVWITAAAATLYLQPVSEGLDDLVGLPGIAGALMFCLLVLGSAELLMALRAITLSPERAQAGRLRRGAAVVGVMAVLVVAVPMGRPTVSDLSVLWEEPVWMAGLWAVWLLWCLTASLRTLTTAVRYRRGIGPSRLRTSIGFLAVGAAAFATYAAVKMVAIAGVIAGSPQQPAVRWLIAAAVAVMAVSAALASSWMVIGQRWERRRVTRQLQSVRPLWERLSPVDETLALDPFPEDPGSLTLQECRFALYRACIEVRDWMRLLAERLPADAWDEALASAGGLPEPRRSLSATGQWIRQGLTAVGEHPGPESPVPPIGEDVDAMVRFITALPRWMDDDHRTKVGEGVR